MRKIVTEIVQALIFAGSVLIVIGVAAAVFILLFMLILIPGAGDSRYPYSSIFLEKGDDAKILREAMIPGGANTAGLTLSKVAAGDTVLVAIMESKEAW